MQNSLKQSPRLSYTRSQPSLTPSQFSQGDVCSPRSRHTSAQKSVAVALGYKMILNKMLTIQDYRKFITFASKFVDRSVLQCKQQPNRVEKSKQRGKDFITDGIFVKKLAQLSTHPIDIIKHFSMHIKTNKRIIKQYERSLQQQTQQQKQEAETAVDYNNQYNPNETEEEREHRLNGLTLLKANCHQAEEKISFQQHIKSNRKSMEVYLSVKKRLKREQEQEQAKIKQKKQNIDSNINVHRNSLKRTSIFEYRRKYLPVMRKISKDVLESLSEIERTVIGLFHTIEWVIDGNRNIHDCTLVDTVGYIHNHKVDRVAIQFQDQNTETTVQHAIVLQRVSSGNQLVSEDNIDTSSNPRYFYRKQTNMNENNQPLQKLETQ